MQELKKLDNRFSYVYSCDLDANIQIKMYVFT